MKFYVRLTFLLSTVYFITGCNNQSDPPQNGTGSTLYYDVFSYSPNWMNHNNDTVETFRVCYSTQAGAVKWKIKNEHSVVAGFPRTDGTSFGIKYSHSYSSGNYLLKIFPACNVPTLQKPTTGIYFQKIDKATGAAVISKQLIGTAEYNVNADYSISEVLFDGQRLYFACNNNFVYAYDIDGNLLWKKGGYEMANVRINYGGYGYIYLHNGFLYFTAKNNTGMIPSAINLLYCLNTTTGALRWYSLETADFIYGRNMVFGKDHIALFDDVGVFAFLNKADGTSPASHAGTGTGSYYNIPIGEAKNGWLVYANRSNDLGFIDPAHPSLARESSIPFSLEWNLIYENYKIYNLGGQALNQFALSRIDPENGVDWVKSLDFIGPTGWQLQYDFTVSGQKIYLLSTFSRNGNNYSVNDLAGNKMNLTLAVFDGTNGTLLSEYKNLPGGITNYHRMYNLVVE